MADFWGGSEGRDRGESAACGHHAAFALPRTDGVHHLAGGAQGQVETLPPLQLMQRDMVVLAGFHHHTELVILARDAQATPRAITQVEHAVVVLQATN